MKGPFLLWGVGLLLLALLPAGCRTTPPPRPGITPTAPVTLQIGLADSAATFADLVTGPYAQHTDRAHLHLVPGNNATLFADLANGQLDALLVHHIPDGSQAWFNPVALDGLVIVVHPDNPVRDLSRGQVQAIYNGRIANWAEVGGPDLAITLTGREPGAGPRILFNQRIMAEQRVSINAIVQPGAQALLDAVAADPGAIGYAMMGTTGDARPIAVDGITPTPATTAAQEYPLTAPLYFVAPAEPQADLRAFLAWLQADAGQAIVGEKYGRVR